MSSKYLGKSFDIHGGGQELKFPHHENELAQAKCAWPDEDFARIWMHSEWVTWAGEKMAKSGKSLRIRDVLKEHDPEVVRLFPDRLMNAVDKRAVGVRELLDRAGDQRDRLLRELAHPLRGVSDERYVQLAQEGELTLN